MGNPRLVVAGASSGVGKTTITCCIIRELRRRGLSVAPFKVGPDYIDPGYLGAAADSEARNLDSWMMGNGGALESFARRSAGSDISVIEGVMGYYDGLRGDSDYASTYSIATITRSPVILVIDASRAARSVAATALGFRAFQKNSRIAGVILNRLGSDRHRDMCARALDQAGIPLVGSVRRDESAKLEERHLGLHSTMNRAELEERLCKACDAVAPNLHVEDILKVAYSAKPVPRPPAARRASRHVLRSRRRVAHYKKAVSSGSGGKGGKGGNGAAAGPVIAVALDSSFNFYYRDNLDALRREGARLAFFSPVSDRGLPECDALYIGGGFPEVLAGPLERNRSMKRAVKHMAEDGAPVYAECGGLMYLAKNIMSGRSSSHRMVGLFDADITMTGRPVIHYTKGSIAPGTPITGTVERSFRGHEFHYSEMSRVPPDPRFASCMHRETEGDGGSGAGIMRGYDGLVEYNTLASYGHLYFDVSDFATNFVASCVEYRRR